MTALAVDEVTVRYGKTDALDRFCLAADSGEIIAVLGPSGSGKSTLLRAVAGLEPLAGGRITLGGRDLSAVPTHRRGLGLMFQDHGLFAHLDVAANIAYGLRIAGDDRTAQRARVDELLTLVGLEGFGSRAVGGLSGGEAQRVALARALAPKPALLMLDEPLGSLDRALRDQLTGDLRRLLTELGQTALHVTHDQAEAFAVADRVVVVNNGRPVVVGRPAQIWSDPKSVFVARFLGHRNLWSVTVDADRTLRHRGHPLGRVGADHPVLSVAGHGKSPEQVTVMVPATAIRRRSDGEPGEWILSARVSTSTFRQGVNEVTAALVDTGDGTEGEPVHFMTTEPIDDDAAVDLVVDCAAIRPLKPEGR